MVNLLWVRLVSDKKNVDGWHTLHSWHSLHSCSCHSWHSLHSCISCRSWHSSEHVSHVSCLHHVSCSTSSGHDTLGCIDSSWNLTHGVFSISIVWVRVNGTPNISSNWSDLASNISNLTTDLGSTAEARSNITQAEESLKVSWRIGVRIGSNHWGLLSWSISVRVGSEHLKILKVSISLVH